MASEMEKKLREAEKKLPTCEGCSFLGHPSFDEEVRLVDVLRAESPAIVNYARIIAKLTHENPGEVFPQVIEETLGLWLTVAHLADEAGRPEIERRTCNNCWFMWDAPRSRPAETPREAEERVCVADPPADKPRLCRRDRPACSRWEVKS